MRSPVALLLFITVGSVSRKGASNRRPSAPRAPASRAPDRPWRRKGLLLPGLSVIILAVALGSVLFSAPARGPLIVSPASTVADSATAAEVPPAEPEPSAPAVAIVEPVAGPPLEAAEPPAPRPVADARPPDSRILQPADGAHLAAGQPLEVAVAADDADGRVSEVDVSLDGGQTWQAAQPGTDSPRVWHLKTHNPAAGAYRLLARAVDQAGNVGATPRATLLMVDAADDRKILNPYAVPGRFVRAQLHDHTANSFDGDKRFTPDVKSWYWKDAGFAVVVYTDHEKISESTAYSDATFQTFPGFESTGDSGHVSGWFVRQVADYRLPAQQRIDAIRRAGGIACVNHPDWTVGYTTDALLQLTGYRALEIYNWLTTKNEAMLRDNLEKWRQVVNARGPQDPVWGVATGDAHGPQFNTGWTVLKVTDLSEASIRNAIESGAMYASNGPDFESIETSGDRIRVVARNARFVRFLDDTGAMVLDVQAPSAEFRPTSTEHWVRIEASDGSGHTAWSEPLWIFPADRKVASADSASAQG